MNLHEECKSAQSLVYFVTNRGLYSELNTLIGSMFLAEQYGLDFYVNYEDGSHHNPLGRWFMFNTYEQFPTFAGQLSGPVVMRDGHPLFLQMVAYCQRNMMFEDSRRLVKKIKYRSEVYNKITALRDSLSLPNEYAAIHIRRGDKIWSEAEKTETFRYLNRIPDNIDTIFLMTDDFSTLSEVQNQTSKEVVCITNPKMVGNNTSGMIESGQFYTETDLTIFLTETEIAIDSSLYVGTMSSNVSRFIAARRGTLDKCISLDSYWYGS